MSNKLRRETVAVQQNFRGDATNSIVRPIYPNSAYFFDSSDHAANLFDLSAGGNIYTRLTNPTNDALGQVISDLEGGVGGLTFSSGSAALSAAIMVLCKAGDNIVASSSLYGGTVSLLNNTFSKFGVSTTFINQDDDLETIDASIKPNTRFILVETITNPKSDVIDLDKFALLAQKHDIPLVVDSTFTPPCVFRPLEHGANIVIHSATKYIGGHGNALCGVLVDGGNYNWANGKFPELSEPDASYHGLIYTEAFGSAAFILKARAHILRDTGGTLSPFDAFLVLTGLQTLHIRYRHVSESALKIAKWLEADDRIEWVSYPGLESHPQHKRAKEYFGNQSGGIFAFGIKGGLKESEHFVNSVKVAIHAVNVGDVRTIVTHPASTTHRQLSQQELDNIGIGTNLIRISVGLENVDDLIEDIDQALQGV